MCFLNPQAFYLPNPIKQKLAPKSSGTSPLTVALSDSFRARTPTERKPWLGSFRRRATAYSQSESASSSATTTQLVCSCKIDAGHWGVTGP